MILACVGEKILQLAGAHFDGVILHPFVTTEAVATQSVEPIESDVVLYEREAQARRIAHQDLGELTDLCRSKGTPIKLQPDG
ncbi:hypothetical protein ACFVKB_47745 [Rhodococcus sp. NPDC127530]|uniref:hypothetical protein n=1 Tax=unclassified Rhodococcus (in: high G+C Gram-positive bacteria) TaxID=192944 RepID=UPI00363906CC